MSLFKARNSIASAHVLLHSPPVCSWAMFALDCGFSAILYWQIAVTAPQTDIACDTISFPVALRDMDYDLVVLC